MQISKTRLLLEPLWRVFAATFLPLLVDAFLKGIDVAQGNPAFEKYWWIPVFAPLIAVALRAAVPQPVDTTGVGVTPPPSNPPPNDLF